MSISTSTMILTSVDTRLEGTDEQHLLILRHCRARLSTFESRVIDDSRSPRAAAINRDARNSTFRHATITNTRKLFLNSKQSLFSRHLYTSKLSTNITFVSFQNSENRSHLLLKFLVDAQHS